MLLGLHFNDGDEEPGAGSTGSQASLSEAQQETYELITRQFKKAAS